MSTPELLPCPFCGGEPSLTAGGPGNAYVRCMVCQCAGDDGFPERVTAAWNTRASQAEIERLKTALSKIDAIRNSIVGYQTVGWSQHIYPLVSALEEAGYHGEGYEKSRETAKTQVDLINELVAENASLRARSGGKS